MSYICMVSSAKGGVGKSTLCSNLGMALAKRGKRVLLIDCDFVNRSLDLLTGLENQTVYGLYDVLSGIVSLKDAAVVHPKEPLLSLLAACHTTKTDTLFSESAFHAIFEQTEEETEPDFILLDTSGGSLSTAELLAPLTREVLIVSSPQITSVRSAEQTARTLTDAGAAKCGLVVNAFMQEQRKMFFASARRKRRIWEKAFFPLIEMIDTVALPLRAVIPFDDSLGGYQNEGLLLDEDCYRKTDFRAAVLNLADRLCGHQIPLFSRQKD